MYSKGFDSDKQLERVVKPLDHNSSLVEVVESVQSIRESLLELDTLHGITRSQMLYSLFRQNDQDNHRGSRTVQMSGWFQYKA